MWHNIIVGKDLIGECIDKGSGYWKKSYTYINIPDGYYEPWNGYCFLLSSSCVWETTITLEDDMKIELFMQQHLREDGKRYKRYHVTGKELIDNVFCNYEDTICKAEMNRTIKERQAREKRNRKVIGDIVYGTYVGNSYGDKGDITPTYFFQHDGVFFNAYHSKVRNVCVEYTVFENVSKYFFEKTIDLISTIFSDYIVISEAEKKLKCLEHTSYDISVAIDLLEKEKENIMKKLENALKDYV